MANPFKATPDYKVNLASWWRAIIGLIEQGFHLLSVDEFLVNRSTFHTHRWTKRGMPERLLKKPTNFKMSVVVANSLNRVEGIMGTKTTFNQIKYTIFLKELINKMKQNSDVDPRKVTVVADNCRFHRTNLVERFFKNNKLLCLFIPLYCPEIKPCEKLINFIKSYVKKEVVMEK